MRTSPEFRRLVRGKTTGCKAVLGLFLLLTGFAAAAQPGPIFFTEHDWTFHVGGQTFGLCEWRLLGDEKYGGGRRTTFYVCNRQLTLMTRTARVVEVALPLGVVGLLLLVLRGAGTGKPANKAEP